MPEGCSGSVGSFCDNGDDNWGNTGRGGSSGKDFAFFRGDLLNGGAGMLSLSLFVDDKSLYLGLGLKSRTSISL